MIDEEHELALAKSYAEEMLDKRNEKRNGSVKQMIIKTWLNGYRTSEREKLPTGAIVVTKAELRRILADETTLRWQEDNLPLLERLLFGPKDEVSNK